MLDDTARGVHPSIHGDQHLGALLRGGSRSVVRLEYLIGVPGNGVHVVISGLLHVFVVDAELAGGGGYAFHVEVDNGIGRGKAVAWIDAKAARHRLGEGNQGDGLGRIPQADFDFRQC